MTTGANGLQALFAEARRLDRLYATWQHEPEPGPQDDAATEARLEAAHFDPGADALVFTDDDPAGTGWLAWRED